MAWDWVVEVAVVYTCYDYAAIKNARGLAMHLLPSA